MTTTSTKVGSSLEDWSAEAFLVGGGLLLASPIHVGLELFLGVPVPSWLVALFVIPGLIASLVGLTGLYPRIADHSPRAALAGGASTVIATTTLVVLLGWTLGRSILSALTGIDVGTPPDTAFVMLAITITLAFILFGITSLRFAIPSRPVGLLLLSFTLPWMVILAATSVYGAAFPNWLVLAIYGPIPWMMLATGYTLRIESAPAGRDDVSVDMVTG